MWYWEPKLQFHLQAAQNKSTEQQIAAHILEDESQLTRLLSEKEFLLSEKEVLVCDLNYTSSTT
jgi:hypothetical protein